MANKVLLKKSSVAGKVPIPSDLEYGELAVNYADGKLYFKNSNNIVQNFSSQLSINGLTDVDTSTTTPNVGDVLKWNGTNWVPGTDSTTGGTGTDADTLDGFDSSYLLNYNNLTNKPNIPTVPSVLSAFTNDVGFITSYTETDPIYTSSSWYSTTNNSSNWNTAYGWGNHASAGYLTSSSVIDWAQIINEPVLFSGDYNDLTNKPTIPSLTGYATESYVNTQISNLVDTAPGTLNTLNELAAALGDDPNFATSIATQLGNKANSADLSAVATSGSYNDLYNKPTLFSGAYSDLTGKPTTVSSFTNDANYVNITQLATKQNTLVSGTNIKTINGQSLLGSGNITITGGSGGATSIDELTDVDTSTTAPVLDQALVWNGTNWVPGTPSSTSIIIEDGTNLTTTQPTQIVDTYNKTVYRTVKYLLQAISGSEVHVTEVTVTHNDTDVFINEYGTLYTGSNSLITIAASIDATDVYLTATPTNANTTIDFTRISIVSRVLGGATFDLEGDLNSQSGSEDLMEGSGTIDLMGQPTLDGDLGSQSGTEDLLVGDGSVDLLT